MYLKHAFSSSSQINIAIACFPHRAAPGARGPLPSRSCWVRTFRLRFGSRLLWSSCSCGHPSLLSKIYIYIYILIQAFKIQVPSSASAPRRDGRLRHLPFESDLHLPLPELYNRMLTDPPPLSLSSSRQPQGQTCAAFYVLASWLSTTVMTSVKKTLGSGHQSLLLAINW